MVRNCEISGHCFYKYIVDEQNVIKQNINNMKISEINSRIMELKREIESLEDMVPQIVMTIIGQVCSSNKEWLKYENDLYEWFKSWDNIYDAFYIIRNIAANKIYHQKLIVYLDPNREKSQGKIIAVPFELVKMLNTEFNK